MAAEAVEAVIESPTTERAPLAQESRPPNPARSKSQRQSEKAKIQAVTDRETPEPIETGPEQSEQVKKANKVSKKGKKASE